MLHNGLQFSTGQASLSVTTATVPTSGSLTVQLMAASTAAAGFDGVAGLDSFRVVAGDWVGAQGRQLQYEFRYMQVRLAANWWFPLIHVAQQSMDLTENLTTCSISNAVCCEILSQISAF